MENKNCRIAIIQANQTYPLRLRVLRPGQKIETCYFQDDDNPKTFHLAYFVDNQIISISSFMPSSNHEIQIRGMATHPDHRKKGYAKKLIIYGEALAKEKGFQKIWCNAREVAQGFYSKLNYQVLGDYFNIPGIGKHIVMKKNL